MMTASKSEAGVPAVSGTLCLSVMILARNEERNLEALLKTLRPWCRDIHLVDSLSTDGTIAIAARYGVHIHSHAFEGHTRQRAWALKNVPFENQWVFALDADHRVTPELRDELMRVFAKPPEGVAGFFVKRRQIFRGRWLRHGGYYPKYMLKIFQADKAFLDDYEFDYRFYVNGKTAKLENDILEENRNEDSISFFIEKHNRFATEQAVEELKRRQDGLSYLVTPSFFGNPDQRTLRLKQIWYGLPLFLRPFLIFFYRYFLRLGFLDGKEGFIFYFLQSFWFRLVVDIRIQELQAERARSQSTP
jgi:glycosyltransferase involved in cell wall biosynthesis